MNDDKTRSDPRLIAELNDLLKLDHDAVETYTLAISALRDPSLKEALTRYRADHERHIHELTALIEAGGGTAIKLPHIPTGFFKFATQAMGIVGGDRTVLLAFKANEGQVWRKYARHAERSYPPEIAEVLRRNARDEQTHYAWVATALDHLGVGAGTATGTVARMVETFHGTAADVIEAVERVGIEMVARGRQR